MAGPGFGLALCFYPGCVCAPESEQVTQDADRVRREPNYSPRNREGQYDLSYVENSRMTKTHMMEMPERGKNLLLFF